MTTRNRSILLSILTSANFFAGFAAMSFAPLLPFVGEDLHLSRGSLGLLVSVLYLGAVVSGFPAGLVADRWGVPKALAGGLVLEGTFIAIAAAGPTFSSIAIFVFLAGLGYGAVNPATSKGVIHWFLSHWRSTAMAVKQMGVTAGTMAAAAVLPAIAQLAGWRVAIGIAAGALVIAGSATYWLYPSAVRAERWAPPAHTPAEQSSVVPVWREPQILFWSVVGIVYAMVQLSGTSYLAVYMVDHFSYGKVAAGMFLSLTQGCGALGRIAWGRVSDLYFSRDRAKETVLIGLIAAVSCIVLGLLPAGAPLIAILAAASVFGFTAVGYNAVLLTLIGEIAGPARAGQAIGFCVTIAYMGVVLGPPAFGFVADHFGYRSAWLLLGSSLAAAKTVTFAYYTVRRRRLTASAPTLGRS